MQSKKKIDVTCQIITCISEDSEEAIKRTKKTVAFYISVGDIYREFLAKNGYDVSVITGFPYYPQWKIKRDYKEKPYLYQEIINGVSVLRSKQYVPDNPTFKRRLVHMFSFTFGNFLNLFKIKKADIVISITPFTTSILLGLLLKIRYKAILWSHIQDFEFDAAIDSGLFNQNKKVIRKILLKIEKILLSKADITSTISYGMLDMLKSKTNTETFYLTNWIDTSLFKKTLNFKHTYLQSESFKILYSGNIGHKQDWDFFFSFLDKIKSFGDVEVVLVGEGAERERVANKIEQYPFVSLFNLVSFSELPHLLSSTDVHILFQKIDVIDTVMPSKLLGMMASGKPSIVTGNTKSEVAKIFKNSKAGYYFDGKSVDEILKAIHTIRNDIYLSNKMGSNGRDYVNKYYSQNKVLDNFLIKINKLI